MTFVLFVIMYGNMTTLEYSSDDACRQARHDVLAQMQTRQLDAYAFCISGQKHEAQQ